MTHSLFIIYRLLPARPYLLLFTLLIALQMALPVSADTRKPNRAAIASAHPVATQAGLDILKKGGNAFDAAVAVAATLGVVEPYSAGLGGGGFWMLHDAKQRSTTMIDARERAPLAATPDLYLNEDGSVNRDQAINGPTSAGIPGQPAALVYITEQYGRLKLQDNLKAAIDAANTGFEVDPIYLRLLNYRLKVMQRYPNTQAIFLKNNQAPKLGDRIVQADLAKTLDRIAKQGHSGFYAGKTAKALLDSVNSLGGIWQPLDLELYQVTERTPIIGQYKDAQILSAAPPSSGGLLIQQMLNMLAAYDIQQLDAIERVHLITEVMRRAYRTRTAWLGDEDYVWIPKQRLLNPEFALRQMENFSSGHATLSTSLVDQALPRTSKGQHTTHFSVLDREGNRVSATLSINLPFGSGFVAGNTGILLNDEMDDFDAAPNAANAYGLVGAGANSIAPGKRPLSSMSPTFVESPTGIAILGTPGGSRIISMVLLSLLEVLEGQPVEQWVSRSRFHHQFLPDELQHEPDTFTEKEQAQLKQMGHKLKNVGRTYGNMHAIHWDLKTGKVTAASDPRGIGLADYY